MTILSCPGAPAKEDTPFPEITGTVSYLDIATLEGLAISSLPPVLSGEVLNHAVQYSIKQKLDNEDIVNAHEGVRINAFTGIIELNANSAVTHRPRVFYNACNGRAEYRRAVGRTVF